MNKRLSKLLLDPNAYICAVRNVVSNCKKIFHLTAPGPKILWHTTAHLPRTNQIQKKSFASKSSGEQNINIPIKQKFDHSKSQTLG